MPVGPAPVGFDERPDIPPRVKRWPDRSRCYKCRCYLSFVVVDRLYCSYECAGREPPISDPTPSRSPGRHVPRQCKLKNGRKFKRRYFTLGRAQEAARQQNEPGLTAYLCEYCNYFHMGHLSTALAEQQKAEVQLRREEQREARREARKIMKEQARKTRQRQAAKRQATEEFLDGLESLLRSRRSYRRRIVQNRRLRRRNNGNRNI